MSSAPADVSPLTIAVIKPCCIGDCVMALPAIDALANAFPYAHIHAFTGQHSAAVFKASENVSRVYITPDQMTSARVPGLIWNLRRFGHDWLVVLDRSRLVRAAARAAQPARLVTLQGTSGIRHETDIYLDAVEAAGVKVASRTPHFEPGADAVTGIQQALTTLGSNYAVIHPGGADNPGTSMPDKRWPLTRFAEIANYLTGLGMHIAVTGGPADVDIAGQLQRSVSAPLTNLAGSLTLMETTAVIAKARLYVGCDTGVSHLAAATGTATVAIFGPTNPERYAPRGKLVRVLAPEASHQIPDSDLRDTSSHAGLPSTSEVTVESVKTAIDELLATAGSDR